jgi:hypothetical protein
VGRTGLEWLNVRMTIAPRRGDLRSLLREVDEARKELELVRSGAEQKKADVVAAQRKFLRTLEAYAAAAEMNRLPLPHRLRVEMTVYRSLDQES